jgi:hypothetical protein
VWKTEGEPGRAWFWGLGKELVAGAERSGLKPGATSRKDKKEGCGMSGEYFCSWEGQVLPWRLTCQGPQGKARNSHYMFATLLS